LVMERSQPTMNQSAAFISKHPTDDIASAFYN
jgi:hypothetical protein